MAEIKIEKKKPVWPWILLAIVLVGVAYFIYTMQDGDYNDDGDTDDIENTNGVMESDSLTYDSRSTYMDTSYVNRELSEVMQDSSRFGTDTTYTKQALHDLAERTYNIAQHHNLESSSGVSDLEQYSMNDISSNHMSSESTTTQSSTADSASQHFKTVSDDIVEVIETLESNHEPRMQEEVQDLKNATSQIKAGTDLSQQQNSLQVFIRKAHELLNNLNS